MANKFISLTYGSALTYHVNVEDISMFVEFRKKNIVDPNDAGSKLQLSNEGTIFYLKGRDRSFSVDQTLEEIMELMNR